MDMSMKMSASQPIMGTHCYFSRKGRTMTEHVPKLAEHRHIPQNCRFQIILGSRSSGVAFAFSHNDFHSKYLLYIYIYLIWIIVLSFFSICWVLGIFTTILITAFDQEPNGFSLCLLHIRRRVRINSASFLWFLMKNVMVCWMCR